MNNKDLCIEIKKLAPNIIDGFIKNQLTQPEYTHENNIRSGISYELVPSDLYPNYFEHKSQNIRKNYIKGDTKYLNEYELEIKSGKYNLLSNKMDKCNWKKKNGNNGNDVTKHLPDGLLLYQKFNIERNIPAIVAMIDPEVLHKIFNDKKRLSKTTNTNVIFDFNIDDLIWYHIQRCIPKMKPEFRNDLEKVRIEIAKKEKQLTTECFLRHQTNECHNLSQFDYNTYYD